MKKINLAVFGPAGAGKSNFLCGTYYWATSNNFAEVVGNESHIDDIFYPWLRGTEHYRKTRAGTHSVTLVFEGSAMSRLLPARTITENFLLCMYDISGDAYEDGAYKEIYRELEKADAAVCLVDIIGIESVKDAGPSKNKTTWPPVLSTKTDTWSSYVRRRLANQTMYLNKSLRYLSNRTFKKMDFSEIPFVYVATKADYFRDQLKNPEHESLETLLGINGGHGYFTTSVRRTKNHGGRVFKTIAIGDATGFPVVRGFNDIFKFIFKYTLL